MAKLGNYYGLCPLIDHKSLLGVTQDSEAGHVIVTLGKNICIKYRIADQKQIHSWRTKDKFSSAVIYDFSSSKYAAVFNSSYIRIWDDGEENIDKLKKYKFTKQIYSLIQCAKQTFVIFKDLSVSQLSKALEVRKEIAEETREVDIVDVFYCSRNDEVYIGIISNQENLIFEWSLFVDGNFYYKGRENLNVRKSVKLAGYVICYLAVEGSVQLLTLWSDGHMYACQLDSSISEDEIKSNKNSVGKRFAILQSLSLKSPVSMVPLNQNYIALYGADWSEEGAVLLLYNTQFKVTQSKVSFKLFTSGSKLWQVENNLLLGMGQNLAVIPYHLHDEELATLIGSHKEAFVENSNYLDSDVTIVDKVQLLDWDTFKNDEKNDIILMNGVSNKEVPKSIASKIDQLFEKGRPEAAICSELFSQLIEERKIDVILDAVDYFMDIPEEIIAKLLEFGLTVDAKFFKNNKRSENLPEILQPVGRHLFLEKILILRFSDILLLPYLRRNLDIDAVLNLLMYIQSMFSHEIYCLPNMNFVESEKKLIEWTSLLLDAKYQNIILSQNESVFNMLQSLREIVEEHLNNLKELDRLYPELEKIRARKGNENVCSSSLFYCVEKMSLY